MSEPTTFDLAVQPPVLRCAYCDGTQPVVLPMKLSEVTAAMDKFTTTHAKCEKKGKN